MIPPSSAYGCGSDACVACSGDAEWQAQRVYIARNEEGPFALAHADCSADVSDPADTMGGFEDGVSQYGWPSLVCDVCGDPLDGPSPYADDDPDPYPELVRLALLAAMDGGERQAIVTAWRSRPPDRYDGWPLHGMESSDWECPDGCPFVFYDRSDVEYHIGWHRAEDERAAPPGQGYGS